MKNQQNLGVRLVVTLFLLMLNVSTALAENKTATNKGFQALFSMPQAKPEEGEWNVEPPKGFNPETESELIRWLARQKKDGADFNQVRHQGTLLHHAIRSGLTKTALWLIANESDVLKPLNDTSDPKDALSIAIEYRRWPIIDKLLQIPSVTASNRNPQLLIAWTSTRGSNSNDLIPKLLARGMPLPKKDAGESLLDFALQQNATKLTLALLDSGIRQTRPFYWPHYNSNPITNQHLVAKEIERADALLSYPILPYLLLHVTNRRDLEIVFKLKIRRPFNDVRFTRSVIQSIAVSSISSRLKRTLLEQLPPTAIRNAIDEDESLNIWMSLYKQLQATDAAWALTMIGDIPDKKPLEFLNAMLKTAGFYDEHQPNINLASAWEMVLSRLTKVPFNTLDREIWMFVPQQHRAMLLQRGYKPNTTELSHWLERTSIESIREFWPHLRSAIPEISDRIHESLLLGFARHKDDNSCGHGISIHKDTLNKAQLLISGGATPKNPVEIDAFCWATNDSSVLEKLVDLKLIKAAPMKQDDRFQLTKPTCQFHARENWKRFLLNRAFEANRVINHLQIIDIPNETNCGLLVSGGNTGGRISITEDGFRGSQHFTPCTDGDSFSEIWRIIDGQLQKTEIVGVAVQGADSFTDNLSGAQFLLVGGIGMGTCGTTPFQVMKLEKTNTAEIKLNFIPRSSEIMQGLLTQCITTGLAECFPVEILSAQLEDSHYTFIDQNWATERQTYIENVLALNYKQLEKINQQGIFPHWVSAAIRAVSSSDLSIQEKRRRTAWLFRDKKQLARSALSTDVLNTLITWLPEEDWKPILRAIDEQSWLLDSLRREAEHQGKKSLACHFAKALYTDCEQEQHEL